MTLRSGLAYGLSSISRWSLKNLLHRPAANFPGDLALHIDPNIISNRTHVLNKGSIVVCGTNGKTTVTNLLADALSCQGYTLSCNRTGANLTSGIASALLACKNAEWGVFECDELYLAKALPELQSNYLLLLNLFRDQLDRCGEIATVQQTIINSLKESPYTVLIYNADDPFCEGIARAVSNPSIPFGINEALHTEELQAIDTQMCQNCQSILEYHYNHYDQLGNFYCPTCNFARKTPCYAAEQVKLSPNGITFDIQEHAVNKDQHLASISTKYTGTYMIYNLLASFAAAHILGCSAENFARAAAAYNPKNGRLQTFSIQGQSVLLNLAKNPTGFNQNIELILQDPNPKTVAFFVNNKRGDGQDVSWLWDINFENLEHQNLQAFAGGMRKEDVAVRLKYAGINAQTINNAHDIFEISKQVSENHKIYIIANYTALPALREELSRMQ